MRKTLAILLGAFLTMFGFSQVIAKEADGVLIETVEGDLTGDGVNETVNVKGILFSPDASYYREIWSEIIGPNKEEWKISYQGGYEPTVKLIDLNHDGVKDIFYQSATGGSGGLYNYQLNTLANGELTEIPLPEQLYLQGSFKDDFIVSIELTQGSDPILMDVSDRSEDYIRLGLYDENGKLLKPQSVMIDPIAFFEPVLISDSKGYGLKSFQQISGAYHADGLGTVESLWYFEDGKWILLQTEWLPSN
ncbi:hypothetical protein [Oceanobacillus manasiensis]|uniref:hypothetical protein n=1 Tax=Oceanobacillus manasiensis TaxID=586413 RepID=UPI0005A9AFA7|nr:hypothetical protein [Oceanobacillus manasiensis]